MAANINTTSTGATQYINKNKNAGNTDYENKYSVPPVILKNLIGCDIKTNIPWESFYIQPMGTYYEECKCNELNTWKLDGNKITLFFSNSSIDLIFKSPSEAVLGDFRLMLIMNGKIIINCNDQDAYE